MKRLLSFLLLTSLSFAEEFSLPSETRQLIVGIADSWRSTTVELQRYEKVKDSWKPVGPSWTARLGRKGLVWGHGIHPVPDNGVTKNEGDGKAPAGVFKLGSLYGYDKSFTQPHAWPYHPVTPRDMWVEDPESPHYNQHLILEGHDPVTDWEKKQQMRQGDAAHALKLFIHHNSPTPTAGAGSAIFFHIWRKNGAVASSGCSVMPKTQLIELARWIDPERHPLYVLLPQSEYESLRAEWKLP